MEEVCDVVVAPLFGDMSSYQYKVRGTDRSVISRTRHAGAVKSSGDASNELFADHLWPGCFVLADMLTQWPQLCCGNYVLELGAGSALPSLVAATLGAEKVVITDYPEDSIIENIKDLVRINKLSNAVSIPFAWGQATDALREALENEKTNFDRKFNLILCAEPLWKDTVQQHSNLMKSIAECISIPSGIAVVTFVHRPTATHLPEHDLHFFELAATYGLRSKHLGSVSKYRDCLEEDGSGVAEVQVYALHGDGDVGFLDLSELR